MITAQARPDAGARRCRGRGRSRHAYDAWRSRLESRRSRETSTLAGQLRAIHAASRGSSGHPRLHAAVVAQGGGCAQQWGARLMRRAGIRARRSRRTSATTDSSQAVPVAANLRKRAVDAPVPNSKRAADIPAIDPRQGWVSLALGRALVSRRILGGSLPPPLARGLRRDALQLARQRRQPSEQVGQHPDQGSQSASDTIKRGAPPLASGLVCAVQALASLLRQLHVAAASQTGGGVSAGLSLAGSGAERQL